MDCKPLLDELALARSHVAHGENLIARQQDLVASLDRDNHDTREALRLLKALREVQRTFIAESKRLEQEVAASSK